MVWRRSIGFCGVIVVTASSLVACQREPKPISSCAEVDSATPVVLYVTHSAGYRHSVLPHSVDVLAQVGQGAFTVHHSEDAGVAVDALDGCAAIAFFTSGDLGLSAAQRTQLLDFVSGGGAFIGFHSATDTYYDWPEYGELVGAYFERHPWTQDVTVNVVQPAHASVAGLPASFEVNDEIYMFETFHEDRVEVVLELDLGSVDTTGVSLPSWGVPLAWVQDYGEGKVFYTALGHGPIWDDAQYRTLLSSGITWALSD